MVKATMDIRLKAVLFSLEKIRTPKDICTLFNISEKTCIFKREKENLFVDG